MRDEWVENTKRLLLDALSAWNNGMDDRLGALLSDDVILSSPNVDAAAKTLVGRDVVMDFIAQRRGMSPKRELVDILIGATTVALLLRDEAGFVTWQLSIVPGNAARRITVSYSVGHDFG